MWSHYATKCSSMLSDYVVVSITNTTTVLEGIAAMVDVTLYIANEGLLVCGTITVLAETMDIAASELKNSIWVLTFTMLFCYISSCS